MHKVTCGILQHGRTGSLQTTEWGQIWSLACFYMVYFYIFKGYGEKQEYFVTCENYMKFKLWCPHSSGNAAASALRQQFSSWNREKKQITKA